jgi:acyl-CoA thioester hydrolase
MDSSTSSAADAPRFHETTLRVRYAETDQMGVVYYANYFIWMEVARTEYCRAVGLRYRDLEEQEGIRLAVAEVSCRYLRPAKYDEDVVVKTRVSEARGRMVAFQYELRNAASGETIATGETRHVFVGRDFRPCKPPERYRRALHGGVAEV